MTLSQRLLIEVVKVKRYKAKNKPATWQYKPDYGLTVYSVVISLYSPETHPTWLPIFTACQPLKALATYSSVVPGATAVMRL